MNHGGGLRKTREIVYPNPVYFTSRLYATQPGIWPVALRVTAPATDVPARGGLPEVKGAPYLDAVALLDETGDKLVLLAVNRHHDRPIPATILFDAFRPRRECRVQTLRGSHYRDLNTWQEPDRVRLFDTTERAAGRQLSLTFAPCSVTALTCQRAN